MIKWPENKKFAFTVFDDTDGGTVENLSPIYDLLAAHGIKTTKSVWVSPSRDVFKGECLEDREYLDFIKKLQGRGFEIAWHGVGSGEFTRKEIIDGLDYFTSSLGDYPRTHANHCDNSDSIYWGHKRFVPPLSWLYRLYTKSSACGEEVGSISFWGDLCKKHIRYMRNRTFNGIDTGRYDPKMPYTESSKLPYSNFWFSSSDGDTAEEFTHLISRENIDRLEREGGFCIVYTHFSAGFTDSHGVVDEEFRKRITYLSEKEGWFVPCETLLEFLSETEGRGGVCSYMDSLYLDLKWLVHRLIKRFKYRR